MRGKEGEGEIEYIQTPKRMLRKQHAMLREVASQSCAFELERLGKKEQESNGKKGEKGKKREGGGKEK